MPLSKIKTNSVADEVFESGSNLIINGAMQVAVRGTSAVAAAANYPSIDRFKAWENTDGAYTVEQSTTVPAGFTTSLKAQVTTADTSLAAAQYAQLSQQIEAQNLQSLVYGTNDAKTVTLSFYVRSNKTGSYSITIYKDDATSYLFSKSYTIDSADTWERKSITITPDSNIKASGGAIANDNGIGFYVFWNLAAGTNFDDATDNTWSSNTSHYNTSSQVNWMDSTSNNFYLTGVQLEIGSSETPFQHESYATTLLKCQRYFYAFDVTGFQAHPMWAYAANNLSTRLAFPTTMRATPSGSITGTYGDNSQDWSLYNNGGWRTISSINISETNTNSIRINCGVSSGVSATDAAGLYHLGIDGGGTLTANAEL